MSFSRCILMLLAALVSEGAEPTLNVGFIYNGNISDFGWTYAINNARITVQDYMKAHGVNMRTTIVEGATAASSVEVMDRMATGPDPHQLIITNSFTFHDQTFEAAKKHPNTNFLHVSGYYGGQPNFITAFGRVYQSRYLSGVVAGAKTITKRIGFVASIPIPEVYRSINAYYLGAQVGAGSTIPAEGSGDKIEERVEVVVLWIYSFFDPDREEEAARRLVEMGCDVVAYHTDSTRVPLFMKHHGLHSVGSNGDARRMIGESVLTSSSLEWAPIFLDMVLATLNNTFQSPNQSHSLWYNYQQGVPQNHDLSNDVPETGAVIFHQEKAKLLNGWDPFCIPMHVNGEKVQTDVPCLSDGSMSGMAYTLDGVMVVDFQGLLGEVCQAGEELKIRITHSPPEFNITCGICSAGSYSSLVSVVSGPTPCILCPEGSFSPTDGSSSCTDCLRGESNVGEGNTKCIPDSSNDKVFIIVISVVVGIILITVPIVLWKVTEDKRKMQKLFSNNAVAESCAESIAAMRLEEVSYIMEISNPNKIQKAFIKIIQNLTEYRRYLPQSIINGETSSSGSDDQRMTKSQKSLNSGRSLNSRVPSDSACTAALRRDAKSELASGLAMRSPTLASVLFSGFSEWCANYAGSRGAASKEVLVKKIGIICDVILTTCNNFRGQMHDLRPGCGQFVILWHRKGCAEAAPHFAFQCIEELKKRQRDDEIPELAHGVAISYHKIAWYGNLGGEVRTPGLINLQFEWLSILHGCAVNRNLPVVTSCSDYKVGFNMTPIDAFTKPPMLLNVAGHVYESSAPWKSVSVFQILSVHEEQEWMYNVTSDTRADEAFVEYSNGRVNEAALLLQDVGTGEEQVACAHLTSTIDGGFTKVGRVGQTNCILAE